MIDNHIYTMTTQTHDRLLTASSLMMGVVNGDDLPMCTPI